MLSVRVFVRLSVCGAAFTAAADVFFYPSFTYSNHVPPLARCEAVWATDLLTVLAGS
jgi:hypothetical protein